jgi:tRNA pseudouridine55 synthase
VHWQGGDFPELTVTIHCSAGTYIRSIARDWGACLGTGATLAGLVRTVSGGFHLADSLDLEAVAAAAITPIPPAIALAHVPRLTLPEPIATRWRQGQKLTLPATALSVTNSLQTALPPETTAPYTVFDPNDQFLGITTLVKDQSEIVQTLITPQMPITLIAWWPRWFISRWDNGQSIALYSYFS